MAQLRVERLLSVAGQGRPVSHNDVQSSGVCGSHQRRVRPPAAKFNGQVQLKYNKKLSSKHYSTSRIQRQRYPYSSSIANQNGISASQALAEPSLGVDSRRGNYQQEYTWPDDLTEERSFEDETSEKDESAEEEEENLKQFVYTPGGIADDPTIHNPLERLNRLGTGWLGAIFEYEGVLVEDMSDLHRQAWTQLAKEEEKQLPLMFLLKKAEGMKSEQVISEVFHWSRNPMEVRRLSQRKQAIFNELLIEEGAVTETLPGVEEFLAILNKNNVPCAISCSVDSDRVEEGLECTDLRQYFEAVITADDVQRGRPDPEGYLYAAQAIRRIPIRCVVIGNAHSTIEAAHDAGMKCVMVASKHPVYELSSADLVVRQLDELSLVNMKQLFTLEEVENPVPEPELEPETEAKQTKVWTDEW